MSIQQQALWGLAQAIVEEKRALGDLYVAHVAHGRMGDAVAAHTQVLERASKLRTLAIEEEKRAVDGLAQAYQGLSTLGQDYINLLKELGVPERSPLMRGAYQYVAQLGLQQAQLAWAHGQAPYAGLMQYAQAMRQAQAQGHRRRAVGVPGLRPEDVIAPWQIPAAQQQLQMALNVYVQLPTGKVVPALVRTIEQSGQMVRIANATNRIAAMGMS